MSKKENKPEKPKIEIVDDSIYNPKKKNIGSQKTDGEIVKDFLKSVKDEIKKGFKG